MLNDPNSRLFRCTFPDCGKIFSKSSNLTQHYRIHSGEKPYQCYICGQTFGQSGNLSKHQRGHEIAHLRWNRASKDKPYKCDYPDCGKSFTAKSSLQNHALAHLSDQPFPCPFANCSQRFMKKTLLNVHIKVSHSHHDDAIASSHSSSKPSRAAPSAGEEPWSCLHGQCGQRFASEAALRTHLKDHSPGLVAENAFLCGTLWQILRSVEAISQTDPRLKELLEADEGIASAKRELGQLPSLGEQAPVCGSCEIPGNEAVIAAAETTSVPSAQDVLGAWLQHRTPQAPEGNKSDEDSADDAPREAPAGHSPAGTSQKPAIPQPAAPPVPETVPQSSQDFHREIVNQFYSNSGAGSKRPPPSKDLYYNNADGNAEQYCSSEKYSRRDSDDAAAHFFEPSSGLIPLEVACGFFSEVFLEPTPLYNPAATASIMYAAEPHPEHILEDAGHSSSMFPHCSNSYNSYHYFSSSSGNSSRGMQLSGGRGL